MTLIVLALSGFAEIDHGQQLSVFILCSTTLVLGFLVGRLSFRVAIKNLLKEYAAFFERDFDESTQPVFEFTKSGVFRGIREVENQLSSTTNELLQTLFQLKNYSDELEERYAVLANNIAASVMIFADDGTTEFCSPYTEVLTGYAPEEIEASGISFFTDLIAEDDLERFNRALRVANLGEDALVRYQLSHQSGLLLWLESRLVPITNEDSSHLAVLFVTIDVTDTLNRQKVIEAQNRDLSDFSYMVSHDLKAPIFTIKGMADALVEDASESLPEESRELLDFIVDATHRLESLVTSIIEYSSLSVREFETLPFSLKKVISDVVDDHRGAIEETGAEITITTDLPEIIGDKLRMYQVFSNIIGNALKYRDPERKPRITISGELIHHRTLALSIEDNGRGIATEQLSNIFRPYKRIQNDDVQGSGIGLACVQKIVERHGGSVMVESSIGEGTTFTLLLPTGDKQHASGLPRNLLNDY